MLCLGRQVGEGFVIDSRILIIMTGESGHGISAKLYIKDSDIPCRDFYLNLREPYSIMPDISLNFLGWRFKNHKMTNFANIGISAPRDIHILRCELIERDLLRQENNT